MGVLILVAPEDRVAEVGVGGEDIGELLRLGHRCLLAELAEVEDPDHTPRAPALVQARDVVSHGQPEGVHPDVNVRDQVAPDQNLCFVGPHQETLDGTAVPGVGGL